MVGDGIVSGNGCNELSTYPVAAGGAALGSSFNEPELADVPMSYSFVGGMLAGATASLDP